ncbi:hypothetical protein DMN91_008698 [Ooceraea biroi]|uniref:Uncharacterized protein n=1 Tax=Ooceraea biroi TaxID=2015173 RepID=A0A3L8DDE3_OOCBI|nr:hypothetical protein DMN91_008698 [Ooceraea biroi]
MAEESIYVNVESAEKRCASAPKYKKTIKQSVRCGQVSRASKYNELSNTGEKKCFAGQRKHSSATNTTTLRMEEQRETGIRGQPLARRPRSRGSSAVEMEEVSASCMEPEDGEEEEAEEREEGEGVRLER